MLSSIWKSWRRIPGFQSTHTSTRGNKKTAHSLRRECAVVELLLQTLEVVVGSDGPVRAVKTKWRRTT